MKLYVPFVSRKKNHVLPKATIELNKEKSAVLANNVLNFPRQNKLRLFYNLFFVPYNGAHWRNEFLSIAVIQDVKDDIFARNLFGGNVILSKLSQSPTKIRIPTLL